MSFRLAATLCLIGATAACSHNNTETARDPSYVNEPAQASTEPSMTPASLEDQRATNSAATNPSGTSGTMAATTPTPSRTEGVTSDARAPLVADTKGTSANDYKADAPSTNAATPARPDAPVQPDNTKVNKRDTDSAALTPMDQRNNETDLKITQEIRQAVMGNGSLSFTAKNVKIITQGGKVTLRGPVKTDQERSAIEAAARKVAGVNAVDNQIEVKK